MRGRFQPGLKKRVPQSRTYWHGVCHFRTFSFFLFLPYHKKSPWLLQICHLLKIQLLLHFRSELAPFMVGFHWTERGPGLDWLTQLPSLAILGADLALGFPDWHIGNNGFTRQRALSHSKFAAASFP